MRPPAGWITIGVIARAGKFVSIAATQKVPPDASQTASQISFPFNYERQPDIEMMRQAAKMQGTYYEVGTSAASLQGAWETGVPTSDPDWPANSDISSVVFVRFTNAANINQNLLTWDVDNNSLPDECAAPVKGTLVVENGNFKTQSSRLSLRGTIVVRGSAPGVGTSGTGKYSYQDEGNPCMQSFTHASGDMDLGGDIGCIYAGEGQSPRILRGQALELARVLQRDLHLERPSSPAGSSR